MNSLAASAAIAAARRGAFRSGKGIAYCTAKITMFRPWRRKCRTMARAPRPPSGQGNRDICEDICRGSRELIKVKNPQHSLAIETALGAAAICRLRYRQLAAKPLIFLKGTMPAEQLCPVTTGRKPIAGRLKAVFPCR